MKPILLLIPITLVLPGCIAKTALDVVTLPVKAAGQTADWMTTSQDEADRNAGRKARKQREQDAKEAKKQAKAERKACREAGYEDCG